MDRGYWIRSKPAYTSLTWHEKASAHLVLASGMGGMAVLKLFQQMQPAQPVTVLYEKYGQNAADYSEILQKVVPENLYIYQDDDLLLENLKEELSVSRMGLRIYVAGSEGFIWDVAKTAALFGVENYDIMKEQTDTLARTVYCVHCKAMNKNVTTNITKCTSCERMLFVREHFSRNLGAYMGLMVDVETPGEFAAIEEIYP
jgi:ferredoxin-NADP reductase